MRQLATCLAVLALTACDGDPGPAGPPGQDLPGDTGEQGPPGDPASPSISAVTPSELFLGRTFEVLLSGAGTDWSENASVVFDTASEPGSEDVVVLDVRPASATALLATIEVSPDATPGLRDVLVTEGDRTARIEGGVNVRSPLRLLGFVNVPKQGAVARVQAQQQDTRTPFLEGFTQAWIGDAKRSDPAVIFDAYAAELFVFIDVTAPAGPTALKVSTPPFDDDGEPTLSIGRNFVDVQAETPQLLPSGVSQIDAFDSSVLAIDAGAGEVVTFTSAGTSFSGYEMWLLPPTGAWRDELAFSVQCPFEPGGAVQWYAPAAGRYYVSLRPFQGGQASIEVTRQPVVPVPLALPETVMRGTLSSPAADVFSVELQAGQTFRASVGDGTEDTCGPAGAIAAELQLVDASGLPVGYGATSSNDLCPRLVAEAKSTGTHYLRVSAQRHTAQFCPPPPGVCFGAPGCAFDYALTVEVE